VQSINLAPIEASLRAGSIPVIASLGETEQGQILNINADFAANELVRVLQPYKIVFLTGTGGLLDGEGCKVIDSINLSTEYDHLMAQPWLNGGMRLKIEQIADLLGDAADLVGVDHAAVGAGQGAVHAQGLGHAGAARRESADVDSWDGIDLARMRVR
jgi:acetylglutamate kinase